MISLILKKDHEFLCTFCVLAASTEIHPNHHTVRKRGHHADLKQDRIMQRRWCRLLLVHYQRTKRHPLSLLSHGTTVVWSLWCCMVSGCCGHKIWQWWFLWLLVPDGFIAPFSGNSLQLGINTQYHIYIKMENSIKVIVLASFWFSLASWFYFNFVKLSSSHLKNNQYGQLHGSHFSRKPQQSSLRGMRSRRAITAWKLHLELLEQKIN